MEADTSLFFQADEIKGAYLLAKKARLRVQLRLTK